MAVVLYKDGKAERFPPEYLENQLAAGWTVDPEPEAPAGYQPAELGEEEEEATEPPQKATEQPEREEVANAITNEEIRLRAQQAGVPEWQTARIKP